MTSLNLAILFREIFLVSPRKLESQLQHELSILSMSCWCIWPAVAVMSSMAWGELPCQRRGKQLLDAFSVGFCFPKIMIEILRYLVLIGGHDYSLPRVHFLW